MSFAQRRNLADRLRQIPLEVVLEQCGGKVDRTDRRKWHTPVGVISITGPKFMNWDLAIGGGGAIDLAMHVNRMDFKAAVAWLAQCLSDPGISPLDPGAIQHALRMPAADAGKLDRVRWYLNQVRGIQPSLLEPLIKEGTLYADARGNAVFVLLGEDNAPVGAELRGTTQLRWRGMAPGSQKDQGFFSVSTKARDKIILCESAIDALSCYALNPDYRCVSTAGARPNPPWLRSFVIDQKCRVYCGFDADPIGDGMAQEMMAIHPSIQRLRPPAHDWNDVLRSTI
jgi:hypothetical protein